jgi:hypothetical protein
MLFVLFALCNLIPKIIDIMLPPVYVPDPPTPKRIRRFEAAAPNRIFTRAIEPDYDAA